MYSVLLVDDEKQVIETLQDSIDWQDLGVDVVLSAADGQEALELMTGRHIDLLVTDIRMPRLGGLELLRRTGTLYPDTHCILLSAYGEFEYAREALQLGVENYLLKPIQIDEVRSTIHNALENIYANQRNTKHLFRNNILMRWVSGDISVDELGERANYLNLNIYLPFYCAVCLRRKDDASMSALRQVCVEALSRDYEVYSFWDSQGRYVCIVGGMLPRREELAALLSRAVQALAGGCPAVIAVGTIVQGSGALFESYRAAEELIANTDMHLEERVLYSLIQVNVQNRVFRESIISFMLQLDDGSLESDIFQMLFHVKSAQQANQTIRLAAQSIWSYLRQQFSPPEESESTMLSCVRHFTDAPGQQELAAAIKAVVIAGRTVYQSILKSFSPVIGYAISYIQTNYAGGLSIKEFCVRNGMNTSYLGYLFKKETGLFFNDYVNQYRIGRAIQLLHNPDIRVNEIAEQVGFCSPSYFVQCFKKQTGLSPVKYRSVIPAELNAGE